MKLQDIKEKALKESINIDEYLARIYKHREDNPNGTDVTVPDWVIPQLEKYCDDNNIPFYDVANDCISTAATYSQLLAYESKR